MKSPFKDYKTYLWTIPGILAITIFLSLPIEISQKLVCGIFEALGVFTLIILSQNKLENQEWKKSRSKGIVCFTLFLVAFFLYLFIYDSQVIHSLKYDTDLLIPFSKSKELQDMINKAGSVNEAITYYGVVPMKEAILKSPGAINVTKSVFIFIYLLMCEFLTLGFGFISNKKLHIERASRAKATIQQKN